jgi:osmotically-inducible protein OsmY
LSGNGVAVLQGTVPSAEASRLAANLLRLQPGVRSVDNQATVEATAE